MTPQSAMDDLAGEALETAPPPTRPRRRSRLRKIFNFAWKYLLGAIFCQHPVSAVLVVGWTWRLMQRSVWRQWWKMSPLSSQGVTLEALLAENAQTQTHVHWPNWIIGSSKGDIPHEQPGGEPGSMHRNRRFRLRFLFGSLWQNAVLGLQGMFNTWIVTLPGCGLWLLAWFAGWNNSFHKGYELAWVGPTAGVVGVALFIAAMLLVPLAQARQAATGQWWAFYDFILIWRLVRQNWSRSIVLAGLYSLMSLPVMALLSLPAFFEQIWPELASLSDTEALAFLKTYYFRVAILGFGGVVVLRLIAARVYARAVAAALRNGGVRVADLSLGEQQWVQRLDLGTSDPQARRSVIIRIPLWTGSRLLESVAVGLVIAIWFSFVAQIFVAEFLNYHPVVGWLNQPLVHLPWFSFIPPELT